MPSIAFEPVGVRKPKRTNDPCGAAGQQGFRVAREVWFEGQKRFALEGSVGEQVRQAHNASRSERKRN